MASKRVRCNKCREQFRQQNREVICPSCKSDDFFDSGFGRWYLEQARRHGYEEAVKGADLDELYRVYRAKARLSCWGYDEDTEWYSIHNLHYSHLYPIKGEDGYVGRLEANNLLIAPARINQFLGNTVYDVGLKARAITPLPNTKAALRKRLRALVDIEGFQSIHMLKPKSEEEPDAFEAMSRYDLLDIAREETFRLGIEFPFENFVGQPYEVFVTILTGECAPKAQSIKYFDYRAEMGVDVTAGAGCEYINSIIFHLKNPEVS